MDLVWPQLGSSASIYSCSVYRGKGGSPLYVSHPPSGAKNLPMYHSKHTTWPSPKSRNGETDFAHDEDM